VGVFGWQDRGNAGRLLIL